MGSLSVVYDQDLSTLDVADGLLVDVMSPAASGSLAPGKVNAVAYVGTATWGEFDSVQKLSDTRTGLRTFGPQTVAPTDLMTFANIAMGMGVTDLRLIRVGDGTQTAGILPVLAANAAFWAAIGKFPGSLINGATITYTYSPLTPPALRATTGNAQKVFVDMTVTIPNGDSELYQGLDGNLGTTVGGITTYAIDAATLAAASIAAMNGGLPNGRGASNYFIGSAIAPSGNGPGAPLIAAANVVQTLGTDGATFAAGSPLTLDAAALGSTAVSPPTGMYAFGDALSGAAFALCGCTDVATIGGLMLAYAKARNGHAVVAFPDGTENEGDTGSLAQKNLLGLNDYGIDVYAGDFAEIVDSVNGAIHRFVDPSPIAAARMAITPPNISPANLSLKGLVVGTSRVGSLNNNPYGDDEVLDLENGGINYFSNDTAGNVGFAIRHNKNSLGKTAGYRGNTAYSRMIQFLILSFKSVLLGALVGQDQGFSAGDDDSRATARNLFYDYLDGLKTDGVIDDYTVICDLSNNKPGLGQLRVDVRVEQNEIIDNVAVGLVTGVGILASVTPATSL